ncbi:hypothetical protein [Paenibacillus taichungensis]|uniref:hypothetical protein n=1 Tax=Paenibacillus taichungensis TaxID=484184 RepID=UPI00399F5B2E
MRTILKEELTWVANPETVNVEYYVTTDGKEFKNREDANHHQKLINIKSVGFSNELPENVVYHYIESLDDLKILTNEKFIKLRSHYIETYTFPCWIGIQTKYDYDYGDEYEIYDISELKEEMKKTTESYKRLLNEVTEEELN